MNPGNESLLIMMEMAMTVSGAPDGRLLIQPEGQHYIQTAAWSTKIYVITLVRITEAHVTCVQIHSSICRMILQLVNLCVCVWHKGKVCKKHASYSHNDFTGVAKVLLKRV